ncbi:hypothetical protein CAPTEDRAFT_202123 [Capitella teleta]|uniref:Uncharacterized protein n=1 Tax=Capitella teleta TaxID=283909 RepID=R7U3L4_CAPTE|nr:hypothetical protein CAPTEDRAFT_202123 [Capitella teleta]|eukprot:ELU00726.1 hypothetical protein CAPTEDRAFT_202123 [Capitella teleta]
MKKTHPKKHESFMTPTVNQICRRDKVESRTLLHVPSDSKWLATGDARRKVDMVAADRQQTQTAFYAGNRVTPLRRLRKRAKCELNIDSRFCGNNAGLRQTSIGPLNDIKGAIYAPQSGSQRSRKNPHFSNMITNSQSAILKILPL